MRIVRLFIALLVAVTGSVAVGAPLAHAAGATVSGYVITPQGTAGVGATVEVDGVAGVQADEFGAFTTPELAPGEHQLRAVSQDSAPSEVLTVTIVDGENQAGYLLILQPFGGTLSGRTLDSNGAVVGGAALSVDGVPVGTSAADGQFSIPAVAGGWRRITATAPGYGGGFDQFVVVNGDTTFDVSVGYPGGTVSGTTTSSSGQVVGNADVYVDGVLVTTSGADGTFTTPIVDGGSHQLSGAAAGFASPSPIDVFVNGDASGLLVSVGSAAGVVSGVVRNQLGEPVAGASIDVDGVPAVTSAADGSYTTAELGGGFHFLNVSAPGYSSTGASLVVDGATTLDLTLGSALATISGVVRDAAGTPVAGATVGVNCCVPSVTSAADGTYSISVSSGPVFISASKPGYSGGFGTFVFVNGNTTVDLSVGTAPSVITGRVTDLAGNPLAGISYWVDFNSFAAATTGPDGVYRVEVSPGTYTMNFRDPSGVYRDLATAPINAVSGEVVVDVTMLPRQDNLQGVVTAPDGAAVEGATVYLVSATGMPSVRTTGADGRFVFTDVPAGSYDLSIQPPFGRNDLLSERIPVTIVDGQIVDLAVRLRPAAFIDLTITAGTAPGSAFVYLYQDLEFDRQISSAEPDASGRVSFGGLEAGTYYVEVNSSVPGYASEYYPNTTLKSKAQRLQLSVAQRLSLAVPLERSAEITGIVYGPDGQPTGLRQVIALAVGAQPGDNAWFGTCQRDEPTDPVGTYRASCLHPSMRYIVQAQSNGVDFAGQFYPKTEDPAKATQFSLRPGQIITKIDFRLQSVVPQLQLNGISPQYFQAGTTTRGVRLFGANFPKDPGALAANVYTQFGDPAVSIKVTEVVNSSLAIATVTVAPSATSFATSPSARTIVLSRYAGSTTYCENCLYLGDAGVAAGNLSGRVTNADGNPMVASRVIATDSSGQARSTYTSTDGRWQLGGLTAGTYTVTFEGTAKWAGQHWRRSSTVSGALPVIVGSGATVTGLNATLQRRAAVQITSITQTPTQFFAPIDAVINGQGLDPIAGGFRAYIEVNGFRQPLTVTYDSSSRLRLSGYFYSVGTFDVVVEWDGAKGLESRRLVGAISISF